MHIGECCIASFTDYCEKMILLIGLLLNVIVLLYISLNPCFVKLAKAQYMLYNYNNNNRCRLSYTLLTPSTST